MGRSLVSCMQRLEGRYQERLEAYDFYCKMEKFLVYLYLVGFVKRKKELYNNSRDSNIKVLSERIFFEMICHGFL